jgi:hypothetical protein
VLWITLAVACFYGCRSTSTPPSPLRLLENEDQVRTEVLSQIPPGTAVASAKKFMENNRFKCEFAEIEGEKVLLCQRTVPMGLMVTHTWSITFPYENDAIIDVRIKTWGTGP